MGTAPLALSAVTAALIVVPLPCRRRLRGSSAPSLCSSPRRTCSPTSVAVLRRAGRPARRHLQRRSLGHPARGALLAPFVTLGVLTFTEPRFDAGASSRSPCGLLLTVWLAGQALRRWEPQSRRLEERSRLRPHARGADAAVVLDERARIARELHDVIGHSVSVMLLQMLRRA